MQVQPTTRGYCRDARYIDILDHSPASRRYETWIPVDLRLVISQGLVRREDVGLSWHGVRGP